MRNILFGDIHGNREAVLRGLSKVSYDLSGDRVIILGDTIDNGPDSCGILLYLKQIADAGGKIVFLRGNHEESFLRGFVSKSTRQSFSSHQEDIVAFQKWIRRNTLYYYRDPYDLFDAVHASPPEGEYTPKRLSAGQIQQCLFNRSIFYGYRNYEGRLVICGHTPLEQPVYCCGEHRKQLLYEKDYLMPKHGVIGIDTGTNMDGKLTLMEINETGRIFRLHQVSVSE